MNKNFKCVIFDLDGTLIDSGPDLANSLNYVLKKQGFKDVNQSVLGSLVGGGDEMMIRKGFEHIEAKVDEKKIETYTPLLLLERFLLVRELKELSHFIARTLIQ